MSASLTASLRRSVRRLQWQSRALSNASVTALRHSLFSEEQERQRSELTRLEKVRVQYSGPDPAQDCTLVMNKGLSTPFNCAMHISELICNQSVLAFVDDEPYDMHRPLENDCRLHFMHFREENPLPANTAFWRSCSFILGYVLERAFKDEHYIELCSFPYPNIRSGSFVNDVHLPFNWQPTSEELDCLSRLAMRLSHDALRFERLDVSADFAANMFKDNRYKLAAIPSIASQSASGDSITLYRLGDHVDISRGPMISNTQLLGRFSVTAVHDIDGLPELRRVQGVAIPRQLMLTNWTFQFLRERAANMNRAPLPLVAPELKPDT